MDFFSNYVQIAILCERWNCTDRCLGTMESAPTCAPQMTAFLCAIGYRPTKAAQGYRGDSKNVVMSFTLSLGINYMDVELQHRVQLFFFVFRSHETCVDVCAQKCTADREEESEKE